MKNYLLLAMLGLAFSASFAQRHRENNQALSRGSTLNECLVDVRITGTYAIPVTESQTWIVTEKQVVFDPTTSIYLDADPSNGFIEFKPISDNDFFLSSPTNGVLLAEVFDGCGDLKTVSNNFQKANTITDSYGNERSSHLKVFPNPASKSFTLLNESDLENGVIELLDVNGLLRTIEVGDGPSKQKLITPIDCEPGLYILRVRTNHNSSVTKVILE